MNEPPPDHQGAECPGTPSIWRMLVVLTAIWIALAVYTNERVLTPQVLARLAVREGGMALSADQVRGLQRLELLSYGVLPIFLTVRIALTALVLQLFAMLSSIEIRYRELFRASLWGFGAVMYGMFVQTLRLDLLGPDLTLAELTVVPDSLAALVSSPAPTMAYRALSLLSLHGLLWIGIVFAYFRFEHGLTPRPALLVPLAAWATIALVQLGLHAFTAQILG